MSRLLIFGLGYTASHLAARLADMGWRVTGTTRDGRGDTLRFDDSEAVTPEIAAATHILSSVPPEAGDPVLRRYGRAMIASGAWLGYLSSTGVYGDAAGAWVDEASPTGGGRRPERVEADAAWLAMDARVFRLPGIYGPGRSPIDRVLAGHAHRTGIGGQVFSRVHVDDIASGVIAGFDGPAGAYNLADERPASQDEVVEYAAALLGVAPPPIVPLDALSPMARGFYAENRRVSAAKAARVLGWHPRYRDYRAGLRAVRATTSPSPASAAPPAESADQR